MLLGMLSRENWGGWGLDSRVFWKKYEQKFTSTLLLRQIT